MSPSHRGGTLRGVPTVKSPNSHFKTTFNSLNYFFLEPLLAYPFCGTVNIIILHVLPHIRLISMFRSPRPLGIGACCVAFCLALWCVRAQSKTSQRFSESLGDFPLYWLQSIFSQRKRSEREPRCAHWNSSALSAPPSIAWVIVSHSDGLETSGWENKRHRCSGWVRVAIQTEYFD